MRGKGSRRRVARAARRGGRSEVERALVLWVLLDPCADTTWCGLSKEIVLLDICKRRKFGFSEGVGAGKGAFRALLAKET